jgi:micrococcal nuclease
VEAEAIAGDRHRVPREAAQKQAVNAGRGLWSACPTSVLSLTPVPAAAPVPTEARPVVAEGPAPVDTAPALIATGACDPSYPELCIPVGSLDLDSTNVGVRRFTAYPPDSHGFDGDYDGVGCES